MSWRRAVINDAPAIVDIADIHYRAEISDYFTPMPAEMTRVVLHDIVDQIIDPTSTMLMVYEEDGKIIAYTWCQKHKTIWSTDLAVNVVMAHVDLTLSPRKRIQLINQMIDLWIAWAFAVNIAIIQSTTVRSEQDVFLRIHKKRGFTVRGSNAFINIGK